MTPHRHWLIDYKPLEVPIKLADNSLVYSAGVGSVVFNPVIQGKQSRSVKLTRVLHVPMLRHNLLSVLFLTRQRNFKVHIDANFIYFNLHKKTCFVASITDHNSAFLDGSTQSFMDSANLTSTLPLNYELWHRRLAHVNHADVKKLVSQNMVTGIKLDSRIAPDPICEPCLAGKMNANPFPSTRHISSKPLELVHMDVHGPVPVQSHSGYKYWIIFTDDCTKFKVSIAMHKKSDTFLAFLHFKAYAENQLDLKIKAIQHDKGGEFISKEFITYCNNSGITCRQSVRNRAQQNGTAERANRVSGERITCFLCEANLPMQFWAEALAALIHIWNCCPTSVLKDKTPHEVWFKKKPDVSHLRVWGCLAYVHIQKDKRKGFSPHMEKGILIGYPVGYKGWKFYIPSTKRTVISERAEFDERYFPGLKMSSMSALPQSYTPATTPQVVQMPDLWGDDAPPPAAPPEPDNQALAPVPVPDVPEPQIEVPEPPSPPQPPPQQLPRRSGRNRNLPGEWWKVRHPPPPVPDDSDDELGFTVIDIDPDLESGEFAGLSAGSEPRNYKEAMNSPDVFHWKQAMLDEINALIKNGTWEVVRLPEGEKPIGSGWVFKIKHNADGSIERFKGRFVAKGYSQRPGLDFNEVFAPTVRMATIRLIIAIAAIEGLHLRSVDISNAFLKGELEEEIYMKQPEGFHEFGPEYVCRLRKSIYGLKQAARQWNKKLHSTLLSIGFKRLESDRSVYIYKKNGVHIIMPVFVDDITLAAKSRRDLDEAVEELSKHFPLRDLGPTSFLLGIHITRDFEKRTIALSQRQYIINMLDRFGHANCRPVSNGSWTPSHCCYGCHHR
jgi:transposase InsO family protein